MVLAGLHSMFWQQQGAPAPTTGHGGRSSRRPRPTQRVIEEEIIPFKTITLTAIPVSSFSPTQVIVASATKRTKTKKKVKAYPTAYYSIEPRTAKATAMKEILISKLAIAQIWKKQKIGLKIKASGITQSKFFKTLIAKADTTRLEVEGFLAKYAQVRERDLRAPRTYSHIRSKTTRETMELEDKLNGRLIFYVNQIKNRLNSGITLSVIRAEFKDRVRNDIRKTVQDSYGLGVNFVTKLDESITTKQRDIEIIEELVTQYEADFWANVNEVYTNTEPDQDISTIVGMIAAAITFGTLSIATRNKVKEYNIQIAPSLRPEDQYGLYWLSMRDDRVDPICEALDGKIVYGDELFFSEVPRKVGRRTSRTLNGPPAHPRCRCRLLPVKNGKIVVG